MPETDYPPGQVSRLGQRLLWEGDLPHITFVGCEGTRFHLAGPLAPVPGAQNGIVVQSITGLVAPFEHLDLAGARQDGVTWLDAVYNAGEIDCVLELSGVTASDSRDVMRAWIGANSPKDTGRLSVYSTDMGEWWCDVRQLKEHNDPMSDLRQGKQKLTWAWRNDASFWQSFDYTSAWQMSLTSASDNFLDPAGANLDTSVWTTQYLNTGGTSAAGTVGYDGKGDACWNVSGSYAREAICQYTASSGATSSTDYQVVSITLKAPVGFDVLGGVAFDVWGRMNNTGTPGTDGVRARVIGDGLFSHLVLSAFISGVEHVMYKTTMSISPQWNEQWTLICGTTKGVNNFKVQRSKTGHVFSYVDSGNVSLFGSTHRGWGFGLAAGPGNPTGLVLPQIAPPSIELWTAGDNIPITQSGFMPLVNRGSLDAWPRYLLYGPGTFTFSDGPAPSDNTITFGPLLEDQIALIETTPRLRNVIDLSPPLPGQVLTKQQTFIENLYNNATNSNLPPLLVQYESKFGIVPPQGPLYSLMTNRFTTPIPGKPENEPPDSSVQIAVSITGGNAASKIIAAVTPQRVWPL